VNKIYQLELDKFESIFIIARTEICAFSGYKIYPGHGKKYIRVDMKSFTFLNGKCAASFLMRKNPRRTNWTVIYRKINRKGSSEEIAKRRTKRSKKFQRGVVGASLETIRAKRNVKPEVRAAERQAALRQAKDKKKEKDDAKKQEKQKVWDKIFLSSSYFFR
jgi:large subunit ribosomal protein L24e